MRNELIFLFAAIALGFVHLLIAGFAATKQRGVKWNLSSREGTPPPLSGWEGRSDRAFQNFKETFPFFLGAIFLAFATDRWGRFTEIGSAIYFFGRLVYLPVYVAGITKIRSLVWVISTVGIVLILLGASNLL